MVVVFPAVTKLVIDQVLYQNRPERLTPLRTGRGGWRFASSTGLIRSAIILNNTFEQKVIFDLRSDLYSHIQLLPLRWFDNRATGDFMTRILEDVNSVERVLIDGIEQGVVAVLQVVIVLGMMFYVSASLALVRPGADASSRRRRALVHAHRASALPAAAPRFVGDEFPAARQPGGHPADQEFRPRARGARALQFASATSSATPRSSSCASGRSIIRRCISSARSALSLVVWVGARAVLRGHDAARAIWSHFSPDRFSLRADRQICISSTSWCRRDAPRASASLRFRRTD